MGTSVADHPIGSLVFVERQNIMPPGSDIDVWNSGMLPTLPDISTQTLPNEYTNIQSVPLGGIWYSATQEAIFLKQEQGKAIP